MKTIILITILSGILLPAHTQNARLSNPELNQQSFLNMTEFDPSTISGSPVNSNNADNIGGSTLFVSKWLNGIAVFTSGKKYNGELQFDLVKNELQFNNSGRPNIFAEPVSAFILLDTLPQRGPQTYVFQSGYPSFGGHGSQTFYMVQAMGNNVHFLKFITRKISKNYVYSTAAKLEYKNVEDWFVFDLQKDKLYYINPKSSAIQKALKDYIPDISPFTNNKKWLTDTEMTELCKKANNTHKG